MKTIEQKNCFKNKAKVIEFLSSIEWLDSHSQGEKFSNKTYYLSHGEYSRPIFYPVRYKDGWAVKVEYFYYPGTFYAHTNGRMSEEDFVEKFLVH